MIMFVVSTYLGLCVHGEDNLDVDDDVNQETEDIRLFIIIIHGWLQKPLVVVVV